MLILEENQDLTYILYDNKYLLRSHPMLSLSANAESDIWSYYKLLKIQVFVLKDTLFVILQIPLIDISLTFHPYMNLPLLHPNSHKSFHYKPFRKYPAVRFDRRCKTFSDDDNIMRMYSVNKTFL